MELSELSYSVALRNGRSALIRAIRPDDKRRLLDAFHRLSGKSIYFRFFSLKKELTKKELKYFTEIDFEHHVALVACMDCGGKENIIGIGRYIELYPQGEKRAAELAFAVDDDFQSLGVGTILFERIVTIARDQGILNLEADVLLDNENMLDILRSSGLEITTTTSKGVILVEFSLDGQELNRYYEVH